MQTVSNQTKTKRSKSREGAISPVPNGNREVKKVPLPLPDEEKKIIDEWLV